MYYTNYGSWVFVQEVQLGFEAQICGIETGSICCVLIKHT
jgi:hypothetical protein